MAPSTPDGAETPLSGATNAFEAIAPYYDLLMRDIPYRRWLGYILRLYRHYRGRSLCPGARVLDLACGTGTVSLLLAARGLEVTGIDASAAMIQQAQAKRRGTSGRLEFHTQDASTFDIEGPAYDLVISLFDSLNYLTTPVDLQRTLERVSHTLKAEGLFIFDINTEHALRTKMFDQADLRESEPIRYRWVSDYEPEERLCTVHMDFWVSSDGASRWFKETHIQRAYDDEEIQDLMKRAELTVLGQHRAYTFEMPDTDTDRIFYIASRESES